MSLERLGLVLYDLYSLGKHMQERFEYCRNTFGMNDLATEIDSSSRFTK